MVIHRYKIYENMAVTHDTTDLGRHEHEGLTFILTVILDVRGKKSEVDAILTT